MESFGGCLISDHLVATSYGWSEIERDCLLEFSLDLFWQSVRPRIFLCFRSFEGQISRLVLRRGFHVRQWFSVQPPFAPKFFSIQQSSARLVLRLFHRCVSKHSFGRKNARISWFLRWASLRTIFLLFLLLRAPKSYQPPPFCGLL